MTNRNLLIEFIQNYQSVYQEEQIFKISFLELLSHPRAFYRDHLPGHITASSWIIDPRGKFALLTHHKKLNRWLQPGGHADGEEDALAVAEKEALEETGLSSLQWIFPQIFDMDIHSIPARTDFPQHLHYDIRFLFHASKEEPFTVSHESKDLAWVQEQDLAGKTGNNASILRMAEKVRAILN